jgi:hypothetical protein
MTLFLLTFISCLLAFLLVYGIGSFINAQRLRKSAQHAAEWIAKRSAD